MIKQTLWSTPSSLSNVEGTTVDNRIHFPRLRIHNRLLGLNNRRLALVVHADDLVAELEFPACAAGRQLLEHGELALAVDDAPGVEVGYARDGTAF